MNITSNNQKGQVLPAVVVAITVALMVGVNISARNSNMTKRVANTDTYSMLVAAVEGGAERFLVADDCVLKDLSSASADYVSVCNSLNMTAEDTDNDSVEDACIVDFPPNQNLGDRIFRRARVSVSTFTYNNPQGEGDHYRIFLEAGQLKEIPLYDDSGTYGDNSIDVCWNNDQTAFYYVAYDEDADHIARGGFYPANFTNPLGVMEDFDVVNVGTGRDSYTWCTSVPLDFLDANSYYGLRIKALYNPADFGIYPSSGLDLTPQGYRITSIGELVDGSQEKATKKLTVDRSFPYMPDVLDYAIYANTGTIR